MNTQTTPRPPTASVSGSLATPAPSIDLKEVKHTISVNYGIEGEASPLTSERDQNFRIATPEGKGFVCKITNPAEDRLVTDFQTQAMLHVERREPSRKHHGIIYSFTWLTFWR